MRLCWHVLSVTAIIVRSPVCAWGQSGVVLCCVVRKVEARKASPHWLYNDAPVACVEPVWDTYTPYPAGFAV